jgi:hypothetical protein
LIKHCGPSRFVVAQRLRDDVIDLNVAKAKWLATVCAGATPGLPNGATLYSGKNTTAALRSDD